MKANTSARALVIVADDNEHNREYARQVLVDRWEVLLASDGLEALELVMSRQPALVFLDLSMPGLAGPEVARRLKADPRGRAIPVVACTAHAMPADREGCLTDGFDGYLSKPYRPAELVACAEQFLGSTVRPSRP